MLVIAHRGLHSHTTENTIGAFEAAIDAGVDGIETDVRHLGDGSLVLFHDHQVAGRPVADMTLHELRTATGIDVPTIAMIEHLADACLWNLEFKTREAWRRLSDGVAGTFPTLLVSSFLHDVPHAAARMGIPAGLLVAHHPVDPPRIRRADDPTVIIQDWKVADAEHARAVRAAGWAYAVYGPVDGADHRAAAASFEADAVITDDIGLAFTAMRRIPS